MTEFIKFPKIPRLNRDIVITEKLDGTNAQVSIWDVPDGMYADMLKHNQLGRVYADNGFGPEGYTRYMKVGSRSRWITPEDDNFGFASWAFDNANDLLNLGPGSHFGEWWGKGIQRGYGMETRKFSLFNSTRWQDPETRPACCDVVPILYDGPMSQATVEAIVAVMQEKGSYAAPGFMNPEGVIVYHTAAGQYFKVTCKDDEKPKGA